MFSSGMRPDWCATPTRGRVAILPVWRSGRQCYGEVRAPVGALFLSILGFDSLFPNRLADLGRFGIATLYGY
ncbi:MAG: hypothetical protein D6692_11240 [Planctomycetota bacterium]|nr:MAG: hypothetical protein D6692_11240 [Planctomycetota bacterium]